MRPETGEERERRGEERRGERGEEREERGERRERERVLWVHKINILVWEVKLER
jgi:hypothetical protein